MKEKLLLKPAERQILTVLLKHDYYLTTREIANLSGVHWNTAKIYLDKFYKKKWVFREVRGNREMWLAIVRK